MANKPAGNKFWGGDDSESSSDSSSDSSDEDRAQIATKAPEARGKMTRWAEESSSDEEDNKKRVVKSATDKRFDQMRGQIKQLKNHMKIDDFASVAADYEGLFKFLDKLKLVIQADGGPPAMFIRTITKVEVYAEKCHEEHQKMKEEKGTKLPENKARAFNTLRAKVRKGNRPYAETVEECKKSPADFESDDGGGDDDASSGSDSDDGSGSSGSGSSSSSGSGSDSSDSDSDSDSDSSSSSSDSENSKSWKSGSDDEDEGGDEEAIREKKMLRWLITDDTKAKKEKKNEAMKGEKGLKEKQSQKKDDRTPKKEKGGKEKDSKKKESGDQEEYTPEELMKKVTEIQQQRGRRGFDRTQYAEKLAGLMQHAEKTGPLPQLHIISSMVSADFDNTGGAFAAMRITLWIQALDKVKTMLPLLVEACPEDGRCVDKDDDDDDEDPGSFSRQKDLFMAFVEKLDDELYKALQFTVDVYGTEYQEILGNFSKLLVLLKRVIKFFEKTKDAGALGAIALRLMDHLHYKPDVLNSAVFEAIHHTVEGDEKDEWVWPKDSKSYMAGLFRYVCATNQATLIRRGTLYQVYHLALHDHFEAGRNILHLGNLADQADASEVRIQILYNRAVAQMGLCGFRLGKINEAHQCLMAICMHNKGRELLAQGLSFNRNMEKTQEQERDERLRQLPYHMHLNLEVLETAHLICAMLLEVPNMAMQSLDPMVKSRMISRVLRRSLEIHDKQAFSGPPENNKESVVSAAKALQCGDWEIACGALEDLKLWEHIDARGLKEGVECKEMIKEKIKIESLRTYLFAYASNYDAFYLDQLVEMFNLKPKTVHSVMSKMMIKEEITAFWDESSKYVLMQHSEPSTLQRLALTLAERGAQAVESNERLVDQKGGGQGFKEQRNQQGQGGQGGRWDQSGNDRRGYKGGKGDRRDDKGKGKGKGKGGSNFRSSPPQDRGFTNARAAALRGGSSASSGQRGWSTPARN